MEDRRSSSRSLLSFLRSPLNQLRRSRREPEGDDGQFDPDPAKRQYARRRQQVRNAQNKHRERKENYIKALEAEVQHLQEAITLQTDLKDARTENELLKELLTSHGLDVPRGSQLHPSSPSLSKSEREFARVVLEGVSGSRERLEILGSSSCSVPRSDDEIQASAIYPSIATRLDAETNVGAPQQTQPLGWTSDVCTPRAHSSLVANCEIAGFDFVLKLEHPCLVHILHPSDGAEGALGHALTLNAATLASAPSEPEIQEPWPVPTAILDRLLELSTTLDLNMGELTPIQAWDRVQRHPKFGNLTRERLHSLADVALRDVRCYGFGAVIDERTFSTLLDRTMR